MQIRNTQKRRELFNALKADLNEFSNRTQVTDRKSDLNMSNQQPLSIVGPVIQQLAVVLQSFSIDVKQSNDSIHKSTTV